jgi:glycosyltransferase involved in cell wall biosynthesis
MSLRVLYIAYPLLPVSEHSAGGAEQVLWTLEREIAARGHHTAVAACAGSEVAGELFATVDATAQPDSFAEREREHAARIITWLRDGAASRFDLIHDHSGWFWRHAASVDLPVLATLHLARRLYEPDGFASVPGNVTFCCVSRAHAEAFRDLNPPPGYVANGIAVDRLVMSPIAIPKRAYLLWLGRICEEKGPHVALDVAHAAGRRIVLAGTVYPFLYHQKYYAREIIPRLKRAGGQARFVQSPTFLEKQELLRGAASLLVTSQIDESSSLVAMEAAACGTPVLAFNRGALPEIVAPKIGKVCQTPEQMVAALRSPVDFDPQAIRAFAERQFSAAAMADSYECLYKTFTSAGAVRGAEAG